MLNLQSCATHLVFSSMTRVQIKIQISVLIWNTRFWVALSYGWSNFIDTLDTETELRHIWLYIEPIVKSKTLVWDESRVKVGSWSSTKICRQKKSWQMTIIQMKLSFNLCSQLMVLLSVWCYWIILWGEAYAGSGELSRWQTHQDKKLQIGSDSLPM